MPIHLLGAARRVLRYPSKLSPDGLALRGLDHHARGNARSRMSAYSKTRPKGFPIGPNVSERVVFNGYFLKIMKYQAGDVARGAPVLVGRIGWAPREDGPRRRKRFHAAPLVARRDRRSLLDFARALDLSAPPASLAAVSISPAPLQVDRGGDRAWPARCLGPIAGRRR